jgi:hypothetical protein
LRITISCVAATAAQELALHRAATRTRMRLARNCGERIPKFERLTVKGRWESTIFEKRLVRRCLRPRRERFADTCSQTAAVVVEGCRNDARRPRSWRLTPQPLNSRQTRTRDAGRDVNLGRHLRAC